ncbi:MAG: aldo/keto reductase [Sedimentisphaerales bacterium]|jgi:predicted aldo/keto reductase-like oxidoreductase
MSSEFNRRNFLKTIGVAGLGSVLASKAKADSNEPNAAAGKQQSETPQVPTRKFGKTDTQVSALCLGAIDITEQQVVLHACTKWGVTYWDTAYGYTNGNSELCIGKFLAARPEMRKKLFIATKASHAVGAEQVEGRLQESLKRMNTDYVDVYYGVHVLDNISQLTDDYKTWAENAKKKGLIRQFGFSTHKNMAKNLFEASKLGWVDAILAKYNFRLMKDTEMQKAIDACYKAGIALTAMKTQKGVTAETDEDKKIMEHFAGKGFTEGQAKLKAVFEDERFASVSVGMESVARVTENVAAVLDKTKLTREDKDVLERYAMETCSGYCAGCAHICDAVLPQAPYVSDVMRSLMYHNSYGNTQLAKQTFAEIPADVRARLLTTDYRLAEQRCPQRMPIARLVREAVEKLA